MDRADSPVGAMPRFGVLGMIGVPVPVTGKLVTCKWQLQMIAYFYSV